MRFAATFQKNKFITQFSFDTQTDLYFDSSTSIYLPPREAEFLESLLRDGRKLKHFLNYALKKYNKLLIRNSDVNKRIRKRIQSRIEKKTRFCFRPDAKDWVEVQMMSLGLGISCCMVVLELIRLDMNSLLREFLERPEFVAIFTDSLRDFKSFSFQFNPTLRRIKKTYTYCRGSIYKKYS